jgi:hypothetical protein
MVTGKTGEWERYQNETPAEELMAMEGREA